MSGENYIMRRLFSVFLTPNCSGVQIEKNERGGERGTKWERRGA